MKIECTYCGSDKWNWTYSTNPSISNRRLCAMCHKEIVMSEKFTVCIDSRLLMRQLARIAGIPEGRFRKMTLVLSVDDPPSLTTEGFLLNERMEPVGQFMDEKADPKFVLTKDNVDEVHKKLQSLYAPPQQASITCTSDDILPLPCTTYPPGTPSMISGSLQKS